MSEVTYVIVEHDGGYAYKVGRSFSETFPSHKAAVTAARRAAGEQRVTGDETGITYEDESGTWREELSPGNDRPRTRVVD